MSVLTTKEIMEIIPHRQPFLLIDTIEELDPGKRAVGKKCVSYNEPYFAGHFPVWLAPQQVSVVPVHHEKHLGYANEVHEKLCTLGFRSKLDARNEKLGYRIREAQLSKIPFQLVIGDGEIENRSVTLRRAQSRESITMSLDDFIAMMEKAVKEKKL